MTTNEPILIVGAGSIGERYIRNLWTLGYRSLIVLRQRNLPLRDIGAASIQVVRSWREVEMLRPRAAFICTPTSLHSEHAIQCVKRGMHVLIEKPLSNSTEKLAELKELTLGRKIFVQIGYMMRYYPLLINLKGFIASGQYGKLLHLSSHWGEYLPDWHPWEDYRQSYAARKELGGGAALTLSHDLDVCNWLLDQLPVQWTKSYNYRSSLEVNVEAGADFLLTYASGLTAQVHLNFFQKRKERWYKAIFDEAVVHIDFFTHTLHLAVGETQKVITLPDYDRNDLYMAEIEDFFRNFDHPAKSAGNLQDASKIIELCL